MSILKKNIGNEIPAGKYQAFVKNGEETGLLIELESPEHLITIHFGAVSALRMLDEGVVLNGLFGENNEVYLADNFSNTIYLVQNGEFENFIKGTSNELYEYLDLKHYVVFTMNYIIEIISKWEPSIGVQRK